MIYPNFGFQKFSKFLISTKYRIDNSRPCIISFGVARNSRIWNSRFGLLIRTNHDVGYVQLGADPIGRYTQ